MTTIALALTRTACSTPRIDSPPSWANNDGAKVSTCALSLVITQNIRACRRCHTSGNNHFRRHATR